MDAIRLLTDTLSWSTVDDVDTALTQWTRYQLVVRETDGTDAIVGQHVNSNKVKLTTEV